ncbi:MAG: hypothetical protein ACOVO9_11530 [Bacteroidia bacterium]
MKTKILKSIGRAVVLLFVILSSSTLKAQQINYKVLENDPEVKNLFIGINVFDAIAYSPNNSIGYNIYGNFLLGNRLQIDAEYRSTYLDDNATAVFAPKDLTKTWSFSAGAEFNLSHKIKQGKAKVVLSSSKVGRTTFTSYVMVPAMFRRIWSVRGGIQQFHNNYQVDMDLISTPNKSDIQYKDASGNLNYLVDKVNFETPTYTMNAFCFYAGLDFKSIVNVKIKPDNYSEKRKTSKFNMYADVLLSPSITYTLVPNEKQAQFKGIDIDIPENKRNNFGWRLGWKYDSGKYVGLSFKTELGQLPGNPESPWFISVGGGMHIGAKIGKKK